MRIGFDGTCLSNRRGFGRFSRRLLDALARHLGPHELTVIIDRPSAGSVDLPRGIERVVVEVGEAPSAAASATGRRRFGDMLAMGRAVARANLDLMYFPATYTFFPAWGVGRLVVTMHDTLALAHPALVFPTRRGRLAWRIKEHAAARLADRIVTVSQTSRRELREWFGLDDDRLRVVSEAADPIFRPMKPDPRSERVLRKYGITPGTRYLLYVGGLSPHKNLPRLIEAFARVDDLRLCLVLVGDMKDVFHTHVPVLREAIARERLEARVALPGYVPDRDLVHLYSRSYALVQPSLMEGFGLPAVEAMACGIPVVSSGAGSLPEVVGDAGIFFDPTDVASIAGSINAITSDRPRRDDLARRALKRSAMFSWDHAALALRSCFEEFETPDRSRNLHIRSGLRGLAHRRDFTGHRKHASSR
jgi:glycosyltransferase involved in cell wall biosynthesis